MIHSVHVHAHPGISWACGCLIEGLLELGVRVSSNSDLHVPSRNPLFTRREHDNSEDVLIISETRQVSRQDVVTDPIYHSAVHYLAKQKPVLVFNMEDDVNLTDYPAELLTYTAHFNRFAIRRGSILPLAFGISSEMIETSTHLLDRKPSRRRVLIRNFNPTFSQSVREALDLSLLPNLSTLFEVDDRRLPRDEYWRALATSSAILAYGGTFATDLLSYPYMAAEHLRLGQTSPLGRYSFKSFEGRVNVLRWDSWRFWEACCFGCAPIQLDFEKYGFILPVMPQPWVHYIPLDFAAISTFPLELADRIKADPDLLDRIGSNARAWALEHYSPRALALRTLTHIVNLSSRVDVPTSR